MKKLLTLGALALLAACGGDDGIDPNGSLNCDFEFSAITNGPDGDSLSSYWQCATSGPLGAFALTDEGEGVSIVTNGQQTNYAGFQWDETGCGRMQASGVNLATGENFTSTAYDLNGSRASGQLTFTYSEAGKTVKVSCALSDF